MPFATTSAVLSIKMSISLGVVIKLGMDFETDSLINPNRSSGLTEQLERLSEQKELFDQVEENIDQILEEVRAEAEEIRSKAVEEAAQIRQNAQKHLEAAEIRAKQIQAEQRPKKTESILDRIRKLKESIKED